MDWVNVNKWFLTQGSQYVKSVLYISPNEHPYWVWLKNHSITLPYFVNIYSLSQPVLKITPTGASWVYATVPCGRYEIKVACKLCEAKLYREMVINLISERARALIGIPNNPRALVLRDPAQYGTEVTIPGRKLKERSEEL